MNVNWPNGPPETVVLQDGEWVCICCFEPAPDLSDEMMAPAVAVGSAHVYTVIDHASTCAIRSARVMPPAGLISRRMFETPHARRKRLERWTQWKQENWGWR